MCTHSLQPHLCPNEVYILLFCLYLVLLRGRNCKFTRSSTQAQRSFVTTASFISFISLLPRSYHKAFHHKLPGLQEHHDSLHISNTTRLAKMGHSIIGTLFGSSSLVTVRQVEVCDCFVLQLLFLYLTNIIVFSTPQNVHRGSYCDISASFM